MNDDQRYTEQQSRLLEKHEAICIRCGKCCGSDDGDPCLNLIQLADGTYSCQNYSNRLGEQTTVSGKTFNCIMIEKALKEGRFVPADCNYLKHLRSDK